jgi:hypothetical protein
MRLIEKTVFNSQWFRFWSLACCVSGLILISSQRVLSSPLSAKITGKILVLDRGTVQRPGLAPIWIYHPGVQLTTSNAIPNLGGRTRNDWKRISSEYPAFATVYLKYEGASKKASDSESQYRIANQLYQNQKKVLGRKVEGPGLDTLNKLAEQLKTAESERDRNWDALDDTKELIGFWHNVNPRVLFDGLPTPLAVTQTDTNGTFTLTLPDAKTVLLAAHIEATIDGQAGHYFWLKEVQIDATGSVNLVLDSNNARCRKKQSEMAYPTLLKTTGDREEVTFTMPTRLRDSRPNN